MAGTAAGESAIVLAGGRSARMGRPKALLPFDGEPLLAHLVSTLRARFDEIVVVAATGQDLPPLPVTLVRDEVAYQGPVAGICYGLEAAQGGVCFVTSCDNVFPNLRLISYLVDAVADHDVAVPEWAGRLQPVHAVYRKTVAPRLREQLGRGELRPVTLFERVPTRRVLQDEVRRFDPEGWCFFNMNTPADYEAAVARWRAVRSQAAGSGVSCTMELFGVARMVANASEIPLTLGAGATLADALDAAAERCPSLVGRVVAPERRALLDGYACNVNGLEFVRSAEAPVREGDRLLIVSADAGG